MGENLTSREKRIFLNSPCQLEYNSAYETEVALVC